MVSLSDLCTLADGLDHPEGVATGPDGLLYAGGEAGQVYVIDPDGKGHEQIADTGGFVLGLCHDAAGRVYVCDSGRLAVLRVDAGSGEVVTYCDSAEGTALVCPNFGAFAPDGSLWFSDSGSESLEVQDGRLLRVPPGGGDAEVIETRELHFPNGLAVAADGVVYVLESFTPRLSVLREGNLETIVDLPGTVPDGVALLADGGFVVACYYPFWILRVSSTGEVETMLDDAAGLYFPMPTNVSFFGPELRRMAIAMLGGWSIKAIDLPFAGLAVSYPEL